MSGFHRRANAASAVEDEERVVYRDLAPHSDGRSLLLSPDMPRRPVEASRRGHEPSVLARPKEMFAQDPLVRLDASDGGEDSEDENPFAALLQHRTSPPPDSEDQRESGGRDEVEVEISQVVEVSTVKSTQGDSREQSARSALRRPRKLAKATSSDSQKSTKRLSFESATSRPARWGSSQSSVKDATNRRKALTSLRQQREQGGPRRKSVSPSLVLSQKLSGKGRVHELNEGIGEGMSTPGPKKPRLSEVLNRANMLSQQRIEESPTTLSQSLVQETPMEDDVILDTAQQMKSEPFSPKIFSPTKQTNPAHRSRQDAVMSKLRGEIGEAIRRAIRKGNKDLTLFRSGGQSMLLNQASVNVAAVESVQDRGYVVISIKRHASSRAGTFECVLHRASDDTVEAYPSIFNSRTDAKSPIQAVFSAQNAEYLKVAPGQMVKVYAPFHFIPIKIPPGSSKRMGSQWLLVGTALSETVDNLDICS